MSKPVYGLKVKPRLYKCHCCEHEQLCSTNHTDNITDTCQNCYWKSAFKEGEYNYSPLQHRPFKYIGPAPTKEDDYNEGCGIPWEKLTEEAA